MIVAVAVVALSTVLSILAGYAFGMMRFRGAQVLFYVFLLGLMVPIEAIDRAALLRPARPRADRHLLGADPAAGRALGGVRHVLDARVLPLGAALAGRGGAARRRPRLDTLWRVLLPLGRPAVLTMMVLHVHVDLERVPARARDGLRRGRCGRRRSGSRFFQGRNTTDFALLAAGAVIVALPVVIVYVFLQRHFIRGMLTGAVKG